MLSEYQQLSDLQWLKIFKSKQAKKPPINHKNYKETQKQHKTIE